MIHYSLQKNDQTKVQATPCTGALKGSLNDPIKNKLKKLLRIKEMQGRYLINKVNKVDSQTMDLFHTLTTKGILNQNLKGENKNYNITQLQMEYPHLLSE